jgi:hypothetical protein
MVYSSGIGGVIMGGGKNIVITAYGHDDVLDKFAISVFDGSSDNWRSSNADAQTYCDMINALELKANSWVHAKVVPENTPVDLNFFQPVRFSDLVLTLDDRSLQKVFREVDSQELAKSLKGGSEAILEKVFRNMSSRASEMLKEDMEYMGAVRKSDVSESQDKIITIIRHLEETGEIIIARSKGDIVI